ncbi:hypothetical protein RND71_021028 [Anisodus tanguticus]|uniref:GH18 domain-containing protein n=1 Tax=Anisodus tanguticus TaxID=243964 RepID=A0AAE1RUH6_9SOLA|nr:hypothetical protein RND71_021028 [Anisodus tanguticus]
MAELSLTSHLCHVEYIGAEFKNAKFTDVPIHSGVEFHFILSFAIDYTTSSSASPTNGKFNIFWDTDNLTPSSVSTIKGQHSNVKVALSLGGDSVGGDSAYFNPTSVDSWVSNALRLMMMRFRVITWRMALWKSYGRPIDYVNFQFYAYDEGTTVSQFMDYFSTQTSNYEGGRILASFSTDGSGGLKPENEFFTACSQLKSKGELGGTFVWSADDSKSNGFKYEKQSQALLAIPH